jgi:hypothetical protein
MAEEFVPFGSTAYWVLLGILLFSRGMDFLSTWIATPNLLLEANPLARRMGWRIGLFVNLAMCALFAVWPLPAIVVITTSLLVASRNLQSAWLMRSLGEHEYRLWMGARMAAASRGLFFACLFGQCALVSLLGAALMYFSGWLLVPFGVGMGLVTYAIAILVYSSLSVWRIRRHSL